MKWQVWRIWNNSELGTFDSLDEAKESIYSDPMFSVARDDGTWLASADGGWNAFHVGGPYGRHVYDVRQVGS